MALHEVNLAARWSDRVTVLAGGRLAACGLPAAALTAATLSTVYAHPITVVEHPLHAARSPYPPTR